MKKLFSDYPFFSAVASDENSNKKFLYVIIYLKFLLTCLNVLLIKFQKTKPVKAKKVLIVQLFNDCFFLNLFKIL